jgi:hypothetical protein
MIIVARMIPLNLPTFLKKNTLTEGDLLRDYYSNKKELIRVIREISAPLKTMGRRFIRFS